MQTTTRLAMILFDILDILFNLIKCQCHCNSSIVSHILHVCDLTYMTFYGVNTSTHEVFRGPKLLLLTVIQCTVSVPLET